MLSLAALLLLLISIAEAQVQFLGIAIAGADIGCAINGSCPISEGHLPLASLGGADGVAQMKHFVEDDGLNMFRLPISWQFLINSDTNATAPLDPDQADLYDELVQACLATGAYCILDLHNFARFDGAVIGQAAVDANGRPSTGDEAAFVALWAALARRYAQDDRVVFGLMNEPHDLPGSTDGRTNGIERWAQTCQRAVTAIRGAGARTQRILLPGTNFASAETFVSTGSADALLAVADAHNATAGLLLLDVHKYLDADNSGSQTACVTNNTASFGALATYLRARGRQALVSETGAAPAAAACHTDFCAQNAFINAHADVYVGLVAWAAGAFPASYVLSLTPTLAPDGHYVDNALMTQCVLGTFRAAGGSSGGSNSSSSSAAASSTLSARPTSPSTAVTTAAATPSTATLSAPAATGQTEQAANPASAAVRAVCAVRPLVLGLVAGVLLL